MSGRIRSLSGARHQLYKTIMCEGCGGGPGHQKHHCKHCSPRASATMGAIQYFFSSLHRTSSKNDARLRQRIWLQTRVGFQAQHPAKRGDATPLLCPPGARLRLLLPPAPDVFEGREVIPVPYQARRGFGTSFNGNTPGSNASCAGAPATQTH